MAFLVVGDPFGATTHSDLMIRAREKGIQTKTLHNASIMNAIGCCGLQLYSFGETVSIPFWTEDWQPDSFYDKIEVFTVLYIQWCSSEIRQSSFYAVNDLSSTSYGRI